MYRYSLLYNHNYSHNLGQIPLEVRSSQTLEALLLQAGVGVDKDICLVYCCLLNGPINATVSVGAETQAMLDRWLPTIINVVKPFLLR